MTLDEAIKAASRPALEDFVSSLRDDLKRAGDLLRLVLSRCRNGESIDAEELAPFDDLIKRIETT